VKLPSTAEMWKTSIICTGYGFSLPDIHVTTTIYDHLLLGQHVALEDISNEGLFAIFFPGTANRERRSNCENI
jgi:hypothetical protein